MSDKVAPEAAVCRFKTWSLAMLLTRYFIPSVAMFLLAGALGLTAKADTILVVSGGTSSTATSGSITATESVYLEDGGEGALSSLQYTVSSVLDGSGDYDGTGTYTGASGAVSFSFVLPGSSEVSSTTLAGTSEAIDGTFTFTGGTGTYAGASGSGTLDVNYLSTGSSTTTLESGTLLSGTIITTPTVPNAALPLPQPAYAGAAILALLLPGQMLRRRQSIR